MKPADRNLLLLALGALLVLPVLADDTEHAAPDMEAMMAAMEKAMAPGEQHAFLSESVGDWTFTSTVWPGPGQPPMKSAGVAKMTMILGGRFLQQDTTGEMMGSQFTGRAVTAYDNAAGMYVSTWIDSMSTGIAVAKGQLDGDTMTMHGEYLDPMSKQMMKVRQVTRFVDKDHQTFQYFMTMPGTPEQKSMEIKYARKGSE